MSTQGYSTAPPSYGTAPDSSKRASIEQEPLLESSSSKKQAEARQQNVWADDASDDFDIGVTVSQSSLAIRQAFIRKVYSILFVMLASTTVMAAAMRAQAAQFFIQSNPWTMWALLIGSFASLLGTMWKRHSHPLNLVLLSTFTAFEAITVGVITSMYDQELVFKALILTVFVFLGLTLFTFQSKYDFSSWGPALMVILLLFVGVSIVHIFMPWSKGFDAVFSGIGVLLFSGYILYDTSVIMNKLSPDEYVLGVISLYLDIINLFLYILRLLNDMESN